MELRSITPLREPARSVTDDIDNVGEGTVRAAQPAVEINITTQTFYNKSYRDIKQGTDTKKTINETGEETTDTTALMEGVVIEPVKNISEPTTGIDSHDSEAESVKENSDDQAQRQRASQKTPASIPKHRDIDDQLTQAEELLSARNDLNTLALGIGLVDSITDLLMNSRKRQDKHKRPQKDRAKKDKRPGSNTGAKKRWAACKALFQATQLLYKSNRRQLARETMGAPTSSAYPLSKEELETDFREKLSAPNNKLNINTYAPYTGKVDDGSLMKPIKVRGG
ncbi:hypothetical protein chiPu_0010966 [Chiloscyllium punctatum]|uniref:Uncharacterized protein n=1 Tax=Chiloscyllium punctatum TaxID=137246 RepID=A0A401SQ22_CHIPU|nr:hypothetical protein [Chiloscyllium punctatum]